MAVCTVLLIGAVSFLLIAALLGGLSLIGSLRDSPQQDIRDIGRAARWEMDQVSDDFKRFVYNQTRR